MASQKYLFCPFLEPGSTAKRGPPQQRQAEAAAQERRNDRLRMVLSHCRRGMPMETEEFVMIPGMLPHLIALHFFPV